MCPLGAQPVAGDPAEDREWTGPQAQAVSQGDSTPDPAPPGVQGSTLIPKYSQRASPTLSCCLRVWFENFGFHLIQKRRWQVGPTAVGIFLSVLHILRHPGAWLVGGKVSLSIKSHMHMLVQGD